MAITMRGAAALILATLVGTLLVEGRAGAHPSDLNTLTLDLILDRDGLVLIDGAANRASYQDAPSVDDRAAIAIAVLDALGIPQDSADVDPGSSVLYHEVGFTIRLHEPFTNASTPGAFRVDSGSLQGVVASIVGRLKLEVCQVPSPDRILEVDANLPASRPDPAGAGAATDRSGCASWSLQPDSSPLVFQAHMTAVSSEPAARTAPHGPPTKTVRTCATRVSGGYGAMEQIPAELQRTSVRIGPVWLIGVGDYATLPARIFARTPGTNDRYPVAKVLVLVRARTRASLRVAPAARDRAALLYDPEFQIPTGGARIDEGTVRVDFPPCKRGDWSEYNGGVVVTAAGCVPLRVRVDRTKTPMTGTLSFGAGDCR